MIVEYCKEMVWQGMHNYQCSRKAVRDGWCKQHHPDAYEARRIKSHETWKAKESYILLAHPEPDLLPCRCGESVEIDENRDDFCISCSNLDCLRAVYAETKPEAIRMWQAAMRADEESSKPKVCRVTDTDNHGQKETECGYQWYPSSNRLAKYCGWCSGRIERGEA